MNLIFLKPGKSAERIKLMSENLKLTSIARVAVDSFNAMERNAKKTLDRDRKAAAIYNAEEQMKRVKEAEKAYSDALKDGGTKILAEAGSMIDSMLKEERAKVVTLNNSRAVDALTQISRIASIPVTQEELDILVEKYSEFSGVVYWPMKALKDIAQKNGLRMDRIDADYGTKKAVLDELRNRLEQFIELRIQGKELAGNLMLSNSVLLRLEEEYSNGFATSNFSALETAQRALALIRVKLVSDPGDAAAGLANLWKNVQKDNTIRDALLYELIKNRLPENVVVLADRMLALGDYEYIREALAKFEKENLRDYEVAPEMLNALRDAIAQDEKEGTDVHTTTAIYDGINNKYFIAGIKGSTALMRNPLVKHGLDVAETM